MELKIGQYKGVEVEVEAAQITDEDVDQSIAEAVRQNPIKVEKEGPVANGDTTVIDFEGLKDGVAFDGGTAKGYELTIGSHSFVPGFEEQMVGMAKGETKALDITFPEQYTPELAGQAVVFNVTVHEIYEMKDAELNEEFVTSLNIPNVTTVDELKVYVKASLSQRAAQETNARVQDAVLSKVMDAVEVDEIPEDKVENAIDLQMQQFEMQLQQQGATLEQYVNMIGSSVDDLRNQIKPNATKQVILELALKKIVELENISVSDEELDAQYENISKTYGMPLEQVKELIKAEDLRNECTVLKANQLIMENAKVTFTK